MHQNQEWVERCENCGRSGHKPPHCAGVNYTFVWVTDSTVKEVLLYGSFPESSWQLPIVMHEHDVLTRGLIEAIQTNQEHHSPNKTNKVKKFTRVMNLPVGRHAYKFKVDNKWTINPLKPITLNGYGGYNNVVEILPFDPRIHSEDSMLVNQSLNEFEEDTLELPVAEEVEVRIPVPAELRQESKDIELRGSWNNWSNEGIPVSPADTEVTVRLIPGNYYYYKFILDQMEWRYDPRVHTSCNQYGSCNNYVYVHARPASGRSSQIDRENIIVEAVRRMKWHRIGQKFLDKPLYGHSVTLVGSEIIIFGGFANRKVVNTCYSIDPTTFIWSVIDPNGEEPTPLAYHGAIAFGNKTKLIIYGGMITINTFSTEVYTLIPSSSHVWTNPRCSGTPPANILHFSMSHVIANEQPYIVIFGGYDINITSECLNSTYLLDLDTMHWSEMDFKRSPVPPKRAGHSEMVTADQSKVIIFGGYMVKKFVFADVDPITENHFFQDMWVLDVENSLWTPITFNSKVNPGPRSNSSFLRIESSEKLFLLFGGKRQDGTFFNDTYLFDLKTHNWQEIWNCRSKPKIEGDIPKPRWDASLIFVNTEIILLGGNLKEEDQYHECATPIHRDQPQQIYVLCLDGVEPVPEHFTVCSEENLYKEAFPDININQ